MLHNRISALRAAALAAAATAGVAGQPASAQLFISRPDFKPAPIEGSDPLVGIPIPGATPAEYRSHLLWNLRAGLNVAALQCQFSPYLRAVDNYNGILAHHNVELASAYTTLNNYFKRVHGKEGQKRFDDYTTSTYNNFSTLKAQYGFCQTATDIAKEALTRPKGELHLVAGQRMRELRNSLVAVADVRPPRGPYAMPAAPVINLVDPCAGLSGKRLRRCQGLPAR